MSKSNAARNAIFDRLKNAQPARPVPVSDFSVLAEKQWSAEEKLTRFCTTIEAVNGKVVPASKTNWPNVVAAALAERNCRNLMIGSKSWARDKIKAAWDGSDVTLIDYDSSIESCKDQLFSVDAGLTTTLGGIAETGSLILWPTKEEPRLLSLVPPIHVAILEADKLHNTFWEAMTSGEWAGKMPTNALLVSGPSKTADIEQELVYGVHGPKELIVILIQ